VIMSSKFISKLEAIGKGVNKGILKILPFAQNAEPEVDALIPQLGPLYNSTVAAITLAEQNAAAVGAAGSGAAKSAAVLGIAGNLIQQGLKDAGQPNDAAAAQKWIDAVILTLKLSPATAAPAPAPTTAA